MYFFLLNIRTKKFSGSKEKKTGKGKWASRFDERIKRQMYQMGCGDATRETESERNKKKREVSC